MLSTRSKIALAATASAIVTRARAAVGLSSTPIVERGGARWHLDLHEGIDFSIYLLGRFERRTAAELGRLVRPGDVVMDVGANIGAHTLRLADAVGPTGCVIAIEPTAPAFAKLQRNVALNPRLAARIRLRQAMLAASSSVTVPASIYSSWPLRLAADVHPQHGGRLAVTTGAVVETLDEVVAAEHLSRVDLIKMDVDGFEAGVLHGACDTLRRCRPTIVMEFAPYVHAQVGGSFPEVVSVLAAAEYTVVEAGSRRPLVLDADQLASQIRAGASINVIATPAARS